MRRLRLGANVVADFRRFELGPPPVEQVLAELRERFSQGEKHLHADHQIPIEVRPGPPFVAR